jgi:hypothetical protein
MRLINRYPGPMGRVALAALPFVVVGLVYAAASAARLAENPQDRILPSFAKLGATAWRLLTEEDRRSGTIVFWGDTLSSLSLLFAGVGIAALIGLILGLAIGLIPGAQSWSYPHSSDLVVNPSRRSVYVTTVDFAREFGIAARGQNPRLFHPCVAGHAPLEPFEVLVDPGNFGRGPGGDLVEMEKSELVAQVFKLGTDALDPLEIIRPARTRAIERHRAGASGLRGLGRCGLCGRRRLWRCRGRFG